MKLLRPIILFALLAVFILPGESVYAQRNRMTAAQLEGLSEQQRKLQEEQDVFARFRIPDAYVFSVPLDRGKYARMIRNLRVVYPIALEAKATLNEIEAHMGTLKSKREQTEYIKSMEKVLKKKYTPILRQMTFSQGKMLIKLIDRETSKTSYELVKQLRGGFSAFMYQSLARLFGANLKDTYDKDGEDKIFERLIAMYEAGALDYGGAGIQTRK